MNFQSTSEFLNQQLSSKRDLNPYYSLRAFAQKLDLSSGKLSEYLSGKRKISFQTAIKIADRLNLPADLKEKLLCTVINEKNKKIKGSTKSFNQLHKDELSLIKNWEHFAILSLFETIEDEIIPNEQWVAKRLGISVNRSVQAINRLTRLGYILKLNDGLKCIKTNITTTSDISSQDIRDSHKQSLKQVIDNIDQVDIQLRDISSITMAINTEKIPIAKKMIKDFRRNLMLLLEEDNQTEVYNLNIQLFPVSKKYED